MGQRVKEDGILERVPGGIPSVIVRQSVGSVKDDGMGFPGRTAL